MKLTSKGLGKLVLPFRLSEAEVVVDEDRLTFQGVIKERTVNWPYRAELQDSDVVGFVQLARRPEVVRYVAERVGLRLVGLLMGAMWGAVRAALRAKPVEEGG